jgi:hypothetical protein
MENTTQIWTREEIITSLTSAAHRRDTTLPKLIHSFQEEEISFCDLSAEIIALLNLLPTDDPIFTLSF